VIGRECNDYGAKLYSVVDLDGTEVETVDAASILDPVAGAVVNAHVVKLVYRKHRD
jgi:hypothetical protein